MSIRTPDNVVHQERIRRMELDKLGAEDNQVCIHTDNDEPRESLIMAQASPFPEWYQKVVLFFWYAFDLL